MYGKTMPSVRIVLQSTILRQYSQSVRYRQSCDLEITTVRQKERDLASTYQVAQVVPARISPVPESLSVFGVLGGFTPK